MNTKFGQKFMHVLIAMLFLFGTLLNGVTPVYAVATGSVASAATPSNASPAVGSSITVTVNIDMTGVTSVGDNKLGSYTGTLNWNPSILAYVSNTGTPAGFTGVINIGSVGTGLITFNGVNATGATGNTVVMVVTFNVIAAGSGGLNLAFSALSAAGSFTDLLSILNLTQGTVTVPGEPPAGVSLDGAAHYGTSITGNTVTIDPHTTGTGANRLMLVGVSWNSGTAATTISSVNFAYGDPLTTLPLGTAVITQQISGQNRYAAIYKLLNPPSGVTGTVTVTFSASFTLGAIAGAANFKGVDQTTPLGTPIGAGPSTGGTTLSVNAATTGNELVFDTVFAGSTSTFTISAAAGQSVLWNPGYTGNANGGGSTKAASASPATTTTMTWNRTNSGGIALAAVPIKPVSQPCYALTLTSGPDGSAATANPTNTLGCPAGQYVAGQVIGLTANPNFGWEVSSWTGTANDSSTALTNSVTMPAGPRTVNVTYQSKTCYGLELSSGDHGGDPTAVPDSSLACTLGGTFVEGQVITLTAHPDTGYRVASWSGTDDDLSKANTNSLTMPAEPSAVHVTYEEKPPEVTLDGAVSSTTLGSGTTISFSHTTGSGDNRLILVGASWNCNQTDRTISSVTFTPSGGSATGFSEVITQLGYDSSHPRYSTIYKLLNPPASTAGTITITFSGSVSSGIMAGAANFAGVDQTTPLGTPKGANGNSVTPSVGLTGLNGTELVFDNVFLGASSTSYTLTAGAGQTR